MGRETITLTHDSGDTIEAIPVADDGRYLIADHDAGDRWHAVEATIGKDGYYSHAEGDTWDGPDGTRYTATRTDNAGSIRWRAG
jgi:hypothetical protein